MSAPATDQPAPSDFIRDIVAEDVRSGKRTKIHTRFPPEPNGYLHIGHTKAICLNFGIAREFGGICNVRMDDTNPEKEETEFIDSIMADIRWLIDGWADKNLGLKGDGSPLFASDYFDQIYEFAEQLVRKGKAYVCDMTPGQTDEYRRLGKDGPFQNRSVEENLDLLARMKAGEFPDGARTLRARIDMQAPNVWLRDPVLYRIRHAAHHQTGDKWCIYPLYDFAHGLSDYLEGITHSLCTLEFEVHRPLRLDPGVARSHRHLWVYSARSHRMDPHCDCACQRNALQGHSDFRSDEHCRDWMCRARNRHLAASGGLAALVSDGKSMGFLSPRARDEDS